MIGTYAILKKAKDNKYNTEYFTYALESNKKRAIKIAEEAKGTIIVKKYLTGKIIYKKGGEAK